MNVLCVRISSDVMGSFTFIFTHRFSFCHIRSLLLRPSAVFQFIYFSFQYSRQVRLVDLFLPSLPLLTPWCNLWTTPLLPSEIINKTKRVQITVKAAQFPWCFPNCLLTFSIFIQKSFRLGDMQAHPYNTMFNLQALIDIQPGFWFIFHVPTYARKIYFRSSETFFYLSTPIWIGSRKCSANFPKM